MEARGRAGGGAGSAVCRQCRIGQRREGSQAEPAAEPSQPAASAAPIITTPPSHPPVEVEHAVASAHPLELTHVAAHLSDGQRLRAGEGRKRWGCRGGETDWEARAQPVA
jgi:hypothetical protein